MKVAFAVADPKTTGGFHANLNLLVTAVPAGTPIRKWLLGNSTARYLAIGTLKSLKINGESALEYESSKLEASGGVPLYTLEFAFNHGGKAYLFTYTAPAAAKERFKPTFMASARRSPSSSRRPGRRSSGRAARRRSARASASTIALRRRAASSSASVRSDAW